MPAINRILSSNKHTFFNKNYTRKIANKLNWSHVGRDGQNAADHVCNNHSYLKITKEVQGIFYDNPIKATEKAWQTVTEQGINPTKIGHNDVYVVPMPSAGYAGGYTGQRDEYDYVTLVTKAGTNKVITAYPSENNSECGRDQFKFGTLNEAVFRPRR